MLNVGMGFMYLRKDVMMIIQIEEMVVINCVMFKQTLYVQIFVTKNQFAD